MSRFQATISTFAAIGTIGLTVVAVYRAVDEQKQRDLNYQKEIQTLRQELEEQRNEEQTDEVKSDGVNTREPAVVPSIGLPASQPAQPAPLSSQSQSSPSPGEPVPPPPLPEPAASAD
jgi:hypothetical protein